MDILVGPGDVVGGHFDASTHEVMDSHGLSIIDMVDMDEI